MSKNVLILSASPRRGGNSDTLCDEFLRGAKDAGHNAEKIFICDKKINYCTACRICDENGGKCVIDDDMAEIIEKMSAADVIVMASPVYFFAVDAQMKTLIDRTAACWRELAFKEFYFIITAGIDRPDALDGTLSDFRGFLKCLDDCTEKGYIFAQGIREFGAVKNSPYPKQAYDMGKSI